MKQQKLVTEITSAWIAKKIDFLLFCCENRGRSKSIIFGQMGREFGFHRAEEWKAEEEVREADRAADAQEWLVADVRACRV